MLEIELVLGLLVAVAALAMLAHRLSVPYPIVLVLGGLLIGFVPGLPNVQLAPDLVFLLFLPPLLYSSASTRRCAISAPMPARSCRSPSAWWWPRPSWSRRSFTRPSLAWTGRWRPA